MNGAVAWWQTTAQRQYYTTKWDYVYNQLKRNHINVKGGDGTEPKGVTMQSSPKAEDIGELQIHNSMNIMSHISRAYMDPVQKHVREGYGVVQPNVSVKPNTSECLTTSMYVCVQSCV